MTKKIMFRNIIIATILSCSMQVKAAGWTELYAIFTGFNDYVTKIATAVSVSVATFYILEKYVKPAMAIDTSMDAFATSTPKTKLADIIGSQAKELDTFWDMVKNSQSYKEKGVHLPHSMLLHGVTGTGKTAYAHAIAHELKAHFYEMTKALANSKSSADTVRAIKCLFKKAREKIQQEKQLNPQMRDADYIAVLFIDEIDLIAGDRKSHNGANGDVLSALLTELDKPAENEQLLIIGATQTKKILDESVACPGRFDLCVEMQLPNESDRMQILMHHLNKFTIDMGSDNHKLLKILAQLTHGFKYAELRELCKKVAVLMVQKKKKIASLEDLKEGLLSVRPEKAMNSAVEKLKTAEPANKRATQAVAKRAPQYARVARRTA